MKISHSLLLVMISGFSVNSSFAEIETITDQVETNQQTVWSYYDCVEWAKAHNVDLRKLQLEVSQSEVDVKSAKDAWLPTVDFSMNHGYSNYPSPQEGQKSNSYSSSYGINAGWTIWDGNKRKYQIESSEILLQERELAAESQIDDLEIGILQAYLNILYNKEAIEIAKQTLEVSTFQAERTKKLTDSGRLSKVEYAQIESQRAQDVYSVVQAESSYASAKMNLKKILELGLSDDLSIAELEFSDDLVMVALPGKEEVYKYACSWNPQIKSNDLNATVLENDIKVAKAGYLPKIGLTAGVGTGYGTNVKGGWGTQMENSLNENIGISFSIPIFDGNSTKRSVAKARLSSLEGELTDEQLRNELSQTIENLYIEARSSQAKYISGLKQVESAELTAELVDRQFDLGLVNPLELLTAHNDLLNARLSLLQSKYMAILSIKMIEFYATQTITLP